MENNSNDKCCASDCCGSCCGQMEGIKKAGMWALVLLTVFLVAKSVNEFKRYSYIGKDVPANSTITVSGVGEIVAVPDLATFNFSVTKESLLVEEAQTNSAKAINDIMAFLEKSGVEKKDIKTAGYNIYPRYEYYGSSYYNQGKQTLAAYVVSQNVEVKVRKIADAGKIIGGIGGLGATDVSGLSFGFDKDDKLKVDARKEAVQKAKTQAVTIAKDLGVKLGRVVSFNENGNYPVMYGRGGDMMTAKEVSINPEITPGQSKITSSVSITYEIR